MKKIMEYLDDHFIGFMGTLLVVVIIGIMGMTALTSNDDVKTIYDDPEAWYESWSGFVMENF